MALRLGLLGSAVVHVAAVGLLSLCAAVVPARRLAAGPATRPELPVTVTVLAVAAPAFAHAGALPGPVLPLPAGPADVALPVSMSPRPRADVAIPGALAAASGGGAPGGTQAWTGRHDAAELRSQAWNDAALYRLPRAATAAGRRTAEAVPRVPVPGLEAALRAPGRLARLATLEASAPGAGTVEERGSAGASDQTRAATSGQTDTRPARPLVAAGPPAVDAALHGDPSDDLSANQASDERHPEAFDLTRPRAGGPAEGQGVAGPRPAAGPSAAEGRGAGDAASPLDVPVGPGPTAGRARLQSPYVRALYARVLERIVWPPRLAVLFEQGEVVVRFTLTPGGAVETVAVDRSSGFTEFDDAVVIAIRRAAPFGPVPASLAPAGQKLQVSAPFVFDNPMIR